MKSLLYLLIIILTNFSINDNTSFIKSFLLSIILKEVLNITKVSHFNVPKQKYYLKRHNYDENYFLLKWIMLMIFIVLFLFFPLTLNHNNVIIFFYCKRTFLEWVAFNKNAPNNLVVLKILPL